MEILDHSSLDPGVKYLAVLRFAGQLYLVEPVVPELVEPVVPELVEDVVGLAAQHELDGLEVVGCSPKKTTFVSPWAQLVLGPGPGPDLPADPLLHPFPSPF